MNHICVFLKKCTETPKKTCIFCFFLFFFVFFLRPTLSMVESQIMDYIFTVYNICGFCLQRSYCCLVYGRISAPCFVAVSLDLTLISEQGFLQLLCSGMPWFLFLREEGSLTLIKAGGGVVFVLDFIDLLPFP